LHDAGVRVVGLEANRGLPGTRTRCAEVRIVADINGPALLTELNNLAPTFGPGGAVLFLTNDRMVETLGVHLDSLSRSYRLSWAHAAEAILPLLRKDNIEGRSRQTGLNYPSTRVVANEASLALVDELRYPVIVKPTRPISAFKTLLAHSSDALHSLRAKIASSLPVIAQEFIPGDDKTIRFAALYLHEGDVVARFEGRKLRSRPMGHTTIAISERNDRLHELALQFFTGLRLSGPVSLELKRAPDGSDWVIEPTVGRTDFWVGLCIANGVNLPLIEYRSEALSERKPAAQGDSHVWVNGERDPAAIAWLLRHAPATLLTRRVRGVFASTSDTGPFIAALTRYVAALPGRAMRKSKSLLLQSQ
jgi:predicted ATP-grasp superfamily ATP-dependent carboligase